MRKETTWQVIFFLSWIIPPILFFNYRRSNVPIFGLNDILLPVGVVQVLLAVGLLVFVKFNKHLSKNWVGMFGFGLGWWSLELMMILVARGDELVHEWGWVGNQAGFGLIIISIILAGIVWWQQKRKPRKPEKVV